MSLPLENVKVLELAQTLAGPFSSQVLSDLGADVIKVEKMTGDETRHFTPPDLDGESVIYLANNRNKRSLTLDLKTEEGINIVKGIAKECDVVIENFRTGTAERLGFGYETMKEINPGIIYLSISGFGRTGPLKDKTGYDLVVQAYSGLMGLTGEPGGPPVKAGFSVVDLTTGLLGAMSVITSLLHREKTGEGQYIDCSLLDSQVMLLNYFVPTYQATGESPPRMGSGHPSLCPYQAFQAKDQHVIVAVANDNLWVKCCEALGWDDLLANEKYRKNKDRVTHKDELLAIIKERLRQMTAASIIEALEAYGVPCSPIHSVEQVVNSEQVIARDTIQEIPHPTIQNLRVPVFPVKFSGIDMKVGSHPPSIGEHTDDILAEFGYSPEEISQLSNKGII